MNHWKPTSFSSLLKIGIILLSFVFRKVQSLTYGSTLKCCYSEQFSALREIGKVKCYLKVTNMNLEQMQL